MRERERWKTTDVGERARRWKWVIAVVVGQLATSCYINNLLPPFYGIWIHRLLTHQTNPHFFAFGSSHAPISSFPIFHKASLSLSVYVLLLTVGIKLLFSLLLERERDSSCIFHMIHYDSVFQSECHRCWLLAPQLISAPSLSKLRRNFNAYVH